MYLPLSRKYRPKIFDEIIGQEHITRTLKNAISMDKLAYAYLFTGSRGVGKTSTARIFAKGLNCEQGPTENPCNICVPCQEISKGISLDVLEIDGASNRGIDEIRNIKEYIKLKPVYGKYKIYIIDEVHMLTQEAFNALLKTLEEPPEHVKFIFATTKGYKVLPTVISRCQRFDFRMIPEAVIVEKLKQIAVHEKLNVQDDALFLIAKNATGSLRDAETMFDQLISFTKGEIKTSDISRMFGTLEQEALLKISEAMLNGDRRMMLDILEGLIVSGKDAMFIANSLIEHFRNIMVMSVSKDGSSHVVMSEDEKRKLEELSRKFSIDELFYVVYTLSNAMELIGKTSLGKIPLEVALLKLCSKEKLIPVSEIMKKISLIEKLMDKKDYGRGHEEAGIKKWDEIKPQHVEARDVENIINPPVNGKEKSAAIEGSEDALFMRIKGVWPEVIRYVKNKKMSAGSYLEEGRLLGFENNKIIVGFSKANTLNKESLESIGNRDIITSVLKQVLEADLSVNFIFSEPMEKKEAEEKTLSNDSEDKAPEAPSKKIEPIIESAVDIFNGQIINEDYI